jgi:hypothetical protein
MWSASGWKLAFSLCENISEGGWKQGAEENIRIKKEERERQEARENCTRSFIICTIRQIVLGQSKNCMGGTYSKNGEWEISFQTFSWKTWERMNGLGADGRISQCIKSKSVPVYAMEALRGREGIAPTHSWPRHLMGVSGQHHAPAALYPRGKGPRYPLDRRLGGPQSRSGSRG